MEGWIKLHRKVIENPIFSNAHLFQLYTYCLLKANHKDREIMFNGKLINIEAGQFITGRNVLSEAVGENSSTTYKRLKKLEQMKYLSLKSNNKNTLVTIVNWESYQSTEEKVTTKSQQSNNKVTTDSQQSNTNKNVENEKNEKIINILSSKALDIMNYFNSKANKKFKSNTKATLKIIQSRLNENFTVDDFKRVIDIKVNEWANDNKMKMYLRPETLFGNKFESYLNQEVKTGGIKNIMEDFING